jgi:TPR repeat protein
MLSLAIILYAGILAAPIQATTAPVNESTPPAEAHVRRSDAPLTPQKVSTLQARASSGDATAQLKLAHAYESGNGVPQDNQKAAVWCKKAAEQGDAAAQALLGFLYLTGQGVDRNKQEAVKWFHKAAFQGNGEAMFNLGASYYNGDGVSQDEDQAYAWFLLAKEAGSPPATAAVLREETALDAGDINESYDDIGNMYDGGTDLPKDEQRAAKWFIKSAMRGDTSAQLAMADRFLNGIGVAQDFVEGKHWCEEASKKGDSRGTYCVGVIYQRGLGVPRNPKEARKWYERAATQDNRPATMALAEMDITGEGTKPNRLAACLLYAKLVREGDQDALKDLVKLKTQMKAKEWKKVERQLPSIGIDAKKLNALLKENGAK